MSEEEEYEQPCVVLCIIFDVSSCRFRLLNGRLNIWIRQRATFDRVLVGIRRCISSWISVVVTKPPIARTTRKKKNTQHTFFFQECECDVRQTKIQK